jgi:hypothetical protein
MNLAGILVQECMCGCGLNACRVSLTDGNIVVSVLERIYTAQPEDHEELASLAYYLVTSRVVQRITNEFGPGP